jgi:hypothetical protein
MILSWLLGGYHRYGGVEEGLCCVPACLKATGIFACGRGRASSKLLLFWGPAFVSQGAQIRLPKNGGKSIIRIDSSPFTHDCSSLQIQASLDASNGALDRPRQDLNFDLLGGDTLSKALSRGVGSLSSFSKALVPHLASFRCIIEICRSRASLTALINETHIR